MTLSKRRIVFGFLAAIGCAWLAVMYLDWSRLFYFAASGNVKEYFASRAIKLGLSLFVGLLVWTTGAAALAVRDRALLCCAFGFVFVADIAFFANNYFIGIGLFSCAQVLLIVRNATGIRAFFQSGSAKAKSWWLLLLAAVILAVNVGIIMTVFVRHAANPMFPIIIGYSFFLCISLYIGIATFLIGHFPRCSVNLIIGAVILLYAGDLTVGLNLILPPDRSQIISTSLTWMFYLPAITLLALSGYRWTEGASGNAH